MSKTDNKTKNSLILGKCSKDSEEGEGYTIFKNLDEDMVAQIKEMDQPSDTWIEKQSMFNGMAKGVSKIDKKLNDKQFLCVDEHGHYFIKNADSFGDTNRSALLQKINDKFNVADVLNQSIGPLYTRDGFGVIKFMKYDEYLKETWTDFEENRERIDSLHNNYDAHGRIYSKEYGAHIETYGGLFISEGEIGGSAMFCHLNEDGNIVNRDYNYDIKQDLNNKPRGRQELIDEILLHIPDVKYQNHGNKWFSEKFCFIIEAIEEGEILETNSGSDAKAVLKLSKLEHNSGTKYGNNRDGKANMPKSAVPATRAQLLAQILPAINSMEFGSEVDISSYIDMREVTPEVDKPVKRVQKTKIDESKYDEPLDWTTSDSREEQIEDYSDENEDWLKFEKALEDFSNGINIGDNEDIIFEYVQNNIESDYLPSFSFEKGEEAPDNSDFRGLIKLPHGVNLTFEVEEGDACEITWAHSIYYTDITNLKIVE